MHTNDSVVTTNWSKAELERSGFDSEGNRDENLVKSAGKPQLFPSSGFSAWLSTTGGSLFFSTYQSGRIFLLGTHPDTGLYALDRAVGTAMGLTVDKDKLWVGTRDQIWRFSNTGSGVINGQHSQAVFMPRTCHLTGNSNTHDILTDVTFRGKHYNLLFANTSFSCIAAPDEHYSFLPVWQPKFISDLKPEDRCHLNGIGAREGELRYASFCGKTDTPLAWKEQQTGTGFIMDLATEETICEGLSMPHSPRWHGGKLWLLNSGEGELGYVDIERKKFIPVANCAGFARGLCFIGSYAVVGLSRLRPKKHDLPGINLHQKCIDNNINQHCGIQIFDINTGKLAHWLNIEGPVTELYDVAFLENIASPYSPGFREPELHNSIINLP